MPMQTHHNAITVQRFTFNLFQENTYLIYNQAKACIIIDPGCSTHAEQKQLSQFINSQQLQVQYLLATHAHIDHLCGASYVQQHYQVALAMHPDGLPLLEQLSTFQALYDFPPFETPSPQPTLQAGQIIEIEGCRLAVSDLPGHAPGHVIFYSDALKIAFVGDTLFQGTIGRTDLWGGDHDLLLEKIRSELFTLPESVIVYPGHGRATTIGAEKMQPIFQAAGQ